MQLPLNLIEPPAPHLADGVVGRNKAALDALQSLVRGHDRGFASLYLWGVPGSGKSFWLKAWANDHPERARYLDCDPQTTATADPTQAINQAIEALLSGEGKYCWLIDNVDAANNGTVAGLFQLYNLAREVNSQIVAAAALAPLHLAMRDDLRTRLGQSLIFELHELSDEEKRNALRERAAQLGLPLSDELLNYLLTRLPRNLGRLTQIIDGLNELTLSRQRTATIPLLKELLDSLNATTRPI